MAARPRSGDAGMKRRQWIRRPASTRRIRPSARAAPARGCAAARSHRTAPPSRTACPARSTGRTGCRRRTPPRGRPAVFAYIGVEQPRAEVGDHEEQHRAEQRVAQHARAADLAAQAEAEHDAQRHAQVHQRDAAAAEPASHTAPPLIAASTRSEMNMPASGTIKRPVARGEIRAAEQRDGLDRREIRRMRQHAGQRGDQDQRGQHQRPGRKPCLGQASWAGEREAADGVGSRTIHRVRLRIGRSR